MDLNLSKSKEIYIDFRKNLKCPRLIYVKGEAVERVLGCEKRTPTVAEKRELENVFIA